MRRLTLDRWRVYFVLCRAMHLRDVFAIPFAGVFPRRKELSTRGMREYFFIFIVAEALCISDEVLLR